MKKKLIVAISLISVAGLLIYILSPFNNKTNYTSIQGEIFHTIYNIKYDSDIDYQPQIDSVFSSFSLSLNPFQKGSLINQINENQTDSTDFMIRHVWTTAYRISELTEGLYDVTCSPMINAWGFGFGKDISNNITQHQIDSLKNIVGYRKISLDNKKIRKADTRMMIDFSSISKGYASDLVAIMLEEKGCHNYLVEIGGEIAFDGLNPKGKQWQIGVEKPIDDNSSMQQSIQLIISLHGRGGLATSGNYRNYHIVDGKKYAHTINPITGYPIQTDVLSATVVAPSCMLADALATACMTVGSKGVDELMKYYPEASYMLIVSNGNSLETIMSPKFKTLLKDTSK